MKKFRSLGIAPIAAAGQFGNPFAAGVSTNHDNGGGGNTTTGSNTQSDGGNNNSTNAAWATSRASPCRRSSTRSSR